MTPREILLRAKERIQVYGWTRFYFKGLDGDHCTVGAVIWAHAHLCNEQRTLRREGTLGSGLAYSKAIQLLALSLPSVTHDSISTHSGRAQLIEQWNDNKAKDQDEVLALFDRAIARGA